MFSFELPRPRDVGAMFAKLRGEAAVNGISFSGDDARGSCAGKGFSGRYEVGASAIRIEVVKKPMLVPQSMVVSEVGKLFARYC